MLVRTQNRDSIEKIKSADDAALHFRENATPRQAKSMTYGTSTRANCRVEERRGSLGRTATLRSSPPLVEPDRPSYGIPLSDKASGLRAWETMNNRL
jgi:hypothetical protein